MVLPDGTHAAADHAQRAGRPSTPSGPNGPAAMPAPLPPTSGYTYAVELSVDEAMAAGADRRALQPARSSFYVENFLGFPVGGIVPGGLLRPRRGRLGAVGQRPGHRDPRRHRRPGRPRHRRRRRAPTTRRAGGAGDHRRRAAAARRAVPPGQSLWRVPIPHFSPWDCNWPYGPPADAVAADQERPGAGRAARTSLRRSRARSSSARTRSWANARRGRHAVRPALPERPGARAHRPPTRCEIPLSGAERARRACGGSSWRSRWPGGASGRASRRRPTSAPRSPGTAGTPTAGCSRARSRSPSASATSTAACLPEPGQLARLRRSGGAAPITGVAGAPGADALAGAGRARSAPGTPAAPGPRRLDPRACTTPTIPLGQVALPRRRRPARAPSSAPSSPR